MESRIPPLWVEFIGKPGTGKSSSTKKFARDMFEFHNSHIINCDIAPTGTIIHDWDPNTDFWDGYAGQFCTKMDDYMQIDMEDARTKAAMNIIRIINNDIFKPTMAALEQKGRVYFDSRLFLTTQNAVAGDSPVPENCRLQDKNALLRRKALVYQCFVHPDYSSNGKISGKFKAGLSKENVSTNAYLFRRVHPETNRFMDDVCIPYETMLRECCESYQTNFETAERYNEFLRGNVTRFEETRKIEYQLTPDGNLFDKQSVEIPVYQGIYMDDFEFLTRPEVNLRLTQLHFANIRILEAAMYESPWYKDHIDDLRRDSIALMASYHNRFRTGLNPVSPAIAVELRNKNENDYDGVNGYAPFHKVAFTAGIGGAKKGVLYIKEGASELADKIKTSFLYVVAALKKIMEEVAKLADENNLIFMF